ncbi:hypothetical protein, partial [Klebsiella pneumoniae]|uniref:hypothetical protein n=1 Tax=Klebsiella pneumoniae TaxID=573 RepID=UPI001AEFEEB2
AENTYDLFVGKTLLHGDVLMWLMKTLLTSRCINQRGAGQTRAGFIRSGNGIRNTLFFIVHSGELSNLSGYESELKSFFSF